MGKLFKRSQKDHNLPPLPPVQAPSKYYIWLRVCPLSGPLPCISLPRSQGQVIKIINYKSLVVHQLTRAKWNKSARWPLTEQRFPLRRVKTNKVPLNHNHTEMIKGRIS